MPAMISGMSTLRFNNWRLVHRHCVSLGDFERSVGSRLHRPMRNQFRTYETLLMALILAPRANSFAAPNS